MNEWISIFDKLPDDDSFVKVKIFILYPQKTECMYVGKYFVLRGENITKWVTNWMYSKDCEDES